MYRYHNGSRALPAYRYDVLATVGYRLEGDIAPGTACAAFDGVREREKAGWTNKLPYPIRVKITR